jgi:hypothetical protein
MGRMGIWQPLCIPLWQVTEQEVSGVKIKMEDTDLFLSSFITKHPLH